MKPLIQIQRDAEKVLGIHTLSGDYEIVYTLLDEPEMSPDTLHRCTRLSSTTFYDKLKALERAGAVVSRVSPQDRRGRLYRLTESMRSLIMDQQKGYMDLLRARASNDGDESQSLNTYRAYIHKGKVVNHLTAEFQILLYLFLKPGISNLNISHVIDVSMTKFHTSVTKLVSRGLVTQHKDPGDGRSKLYRLSDPAQKVLEELHIKMFEWRGARS